MITLKVTPDSGDSYVVTATSRDVLTWEKTTKGNKSFVNLMAQPNLIDFYKLAHLASWRQGLTALTFQEFENSCEVAFDEEEQDEEPDPTPPAPSAGPSSASQSEPASPRPRGRKKANGQS
jgi:hypothetical protein